MTDATVEKVGARVRLRFERALSAPPEAVWRALTDPTEVAAWFPCEIIVDQWRPGAALRFVFAGTGGMELSGTVLDCDEPRVLSFTWGEETLTFELSAAGEGTRLVMTDELDPPIAARNAAGWDGCLDRLGGMAPEDGSWNVRFERYVGAFEAALGPQEGPPAGRG
jgi:uncharacterized protein YndB with AHSA1/START domain